MDVASPQTLRLGPIVPDGHTHQQTEVGMVMRLPPGTELLEQTGREPRQTLLVPLAARHQGSSKPLARRGGTARSLADRIDGGQYFIPSCPC
jgi:hypothetical protein